MMLKVFLFGSSKAEQKLKTSLDSKGFHLTRLTDPAEAVCRLKQEKCDVFVVDSAVEDAPVVCHTTSNLNHIPLMLYVSRRQTNWERLTSLNVDGYLPCSVGGAELAARLQAVVRRHSSKLKLAISTEEQIWKKKQLPKR